ncbi:hypothetical protein Nepgr_033037 [Nepenthes gracilis]|uniref:TPX2 C-terminal domain-containing protein n=1 Tax=Nepenthes gracilis TaxID=150966 RepID=A0AAD3TL63_NEPGR|nr:hypothetical protein Nepgr_033037 [Nepenthes gracilis]
MDNPQIPESCNNGVEQREEQELPKKIDDGRDHALKENEEKVKLEVPKKSPKVTTPKKATNITTAKKKPAFPRPKSPLISTPKSSKPALSGTIMSTTTPLTAEKRSNFSPLTARKTTSAESKKVAPAYLHMSLCLGPASSGPGSLAITRKSLIMERMGDKDIVRRAFKTFQNNFSELLSSSSGKSSATKQFSRKEAERKRWVSETPMRKNEGMDKAVKNTSAPHGKQGMRKASTSLELPKIAGVEKGNGTTVLSSFGMKNHYMPSKQKRSSKMPEEIAKANEAGRTLNQSKTKVEKELEIKKLQNCHNFKAKPMPGSYQGTGQTKSAVHKLYGVRLLNVYSKRFIAQGISFE